MQTGGTERQVLSSWKEIAGYLRISIRTAQYWERERGLPVRRLPGKKERVWADPAELDRWRQTNLEEARQPSRPRFRRLWAVAAIGALVVAGVAYLLSTRKGPPASFRHEFKSLIATDKEGRELWRKTFEEPLYHGETPDQMQEGHRAWFGDVDGDGRLELLYGYRPITLERDGGILFCFSEDGREKWRFVPGRAVVSTAIAAFPMAYQVGNVTPLAAGRDGTRRIAVASSNVPRYPTQVVVLSHRGALLGEYWHSGHLVQLEVADLDGDGNQEMVLTGISNGNHAATLVVLDPNDLRGASHEENQDYQLQGFPPGHEKVRILFPRTCINRKFHEYGVPGRPAIQGDSITVAVRENVTPEALPALVYYRLNRKLELAEAFVNDPFRVLHRELEAAGQLHHPLTDKEISELRHLRYLKRLGP